MGAVHSVIAINTEHKKDWKARGLLRKPNDCSEYRAMSPKERQRVSDRIYRKNNIDERRAATKEWFVRNPDYNREYIRSKAMGNPALYLWKLCKRRSEERGTEFTIKVSDIVVPECCPILGIKLHLEAGRGRNGSSASVDRINNSKGYVPGNVRVISMRANWIKGDASVEEMEKVLQYMKDNA